MHTEENKSKRGGGPKNRHVKPGEQVASNRAMHCNMKLIENAEGEYDAVVDRNSTFTVIRGEYYPIGKNFNYPQVWGRKYAATKLLEYIIADRKKQIELAETELAKLQRCMDKVNEWKDTDQ